MTFDNTGFLLEGIRLSSGNDVFTFPPRTLITDEIRFSQSPWRSEYAIITDSLNGSTNFDIADPNLRFLWTRNELSTVRFDYDNYSRRWNTMPGSVPDMLGVISNNPRLVASIPDLSNPSSRYSLYLGSPSRIITFDILVVSDPTRFTSIASGFVQISASDGSINFSETDILNKSYIGEKVYQTRQSFFDRSKTDGLIGKISQSPLTEYNIFLNPIPSNSQIPRVRIDGRSYLSPIQVNKESDLGSPASGTFTWSLDTGKIKLSQDDIIAFPLEGIYYDGVILGAISMQRVSFGPFKAHPSVGGSIPVSLASDKTSFVLFAEIPNQPTYYIASIEVDSSAGLPLFPPAPGHAYVDIKTGNVYFSIEDSEILKNRQMSYVKTIVEIENGVSIQFFRNGINSYGYSTVSDFTVRYKVSEQVMVDGLIQSPFFMLPTVPVIDSTLGYKISSGPGSTGSFIGDLVNSKDPNKPGIGFFVDLNKKQFSFTNRATKTAVLQKDASTIKLPDSVITPYGVDIKKNGTSITPGVDFSLDQSSGLIEFTSPVGENDPLNILDISGSFGLNTFSSKDSVFSSSHVGKYLLVKSGLNSGLYEINSRISPNEVSVSRPFPYQNISGLADLRFDSETVADRVWSDFFPPYKKITVSRGKNSGTQISLTSSEFGVFATTGQINLSVPADPDEVFKVTYVFLSSPDEGVTVTPVSITEYAGFKIRQEKPTTKSGSPIITINPKGKTVDTTKPISVYVDGITQDSDSFVFTAPGTIQLKNPVTTEPITVNYFVREASGGETNFNLNSSPIEVDFPTISSTEDTHLNGDVRSVIRPGSAICIDDKYAVIVVSLSYDSVTDKTTLKLESNPHEDFVGLKLKVSDSVNGTFRTPITNSIYPCSKGANSIVVNGTISCPQGTILTMDSDSYIVSSCKYDKASDKTTISIATSATKNYLVPELFKTIRPVFAPSTTFNTVKSAVVSYPFTLVKQGTSQKILTQGIDYEVSDGGGITLNSNLVYGESLKSLYVGRSDQKTGTSFSYNYASVISPNNSNGLLTQRLLYSYNLYSPDTFFFRVESVVSYIPEVYDELKKSAQSSGVSGPNIQDKSSLKTKDFGSPGLYFNEQRYSNLDIVISRFLKFYNDLTNSYEDILCNLDGRVVGGTSGKFRFDGKRNNPVRETYESVTNDIDDRLRIFDVVTITSFNPISFSPVSAVLPLWKPSGKSRVFPTEKVATAAINGDVGPSNYGKVLGSFNQSNITSSRTFTSTRATSKVVSIDATKRVFTVESNGNVKNMVPPFLVGMDMIVYGRDGKLDTFGKITNVSSLTTSANTLYNITLDTATTLTSDTIGCILQNVSDPLNLLNHFYTPYRDISLNADNGQLTNITVNIASFTNGQLPIIGNELVDSSITFGNSDTSPRRFPALDGSILTDSGRVSTPILFRTSELELLQKEYDAYSSVGKGAVQAGGTSITGVTGSVPAVGNSVRWVDGVNAGTISIVASAGLTSFTIITAITVDLPGSNYVVISSVSVDPVDLVAKQIGLINTNVVTLPAPGSLFSPGPIIGGIASENKCIDSIALSLGSISNQSASGSISGSTISDSLADFSLIKTNYLLYVPYGVNTGLYKILSFTKDTITIKTDSPYFGFVSSVPSPYIVINPWAFINEIEFTLVSSFLRKNTSYLAELIAWQSTMSVSGYSARQVKIKERITQITEFIEIISGLLGQNDNIYNMRFLWIQQRVDRKIGTLSQMDASMKERLEATEKLLADQRKLLMVSKLV